MEACSRSPKHVHLLTKKKLKAPPMRGRFVFMKDSQDGGLLPQPRACASLNEEKSQSSAIANASLIVND